MMTGQPEDEAISLALHFGDSCISGVGKILEILLRATENYKAAREGGFREDGVVKKAAKAAGGAVRREAEWRVDGMGSLGFVKNSALGASATFVDAPDVFDHNKDGSLTPEGKRQLAALRRALTDNGIGVSIERGIPGDGQLRLGVAADNIGLLHDAILRSGLRLIDEGVIEKEDFPHGEQAIARTTEGGYPETFDYAGLSFSSDAEREDTWVACEKDDPRTRIYVTCHDGETASWEVTRNGKSLAQGRVAPLSSDGNDPRIRCYKPGDLAYEPGPDGEPVPVWKRDARGEVVKDEAGKPVQARMRVPCGPDDPECAGVELRAGLDDFSIARPGQPLESAIFDASVRSQMSRIPDKVRDETESRVSELNRGDEILGKGSARAEGRQGAAAPERRAPRAGGHDEGSVNRAMRAIEAAARHSEKRQAPSVPASRRAGGHADGHDKRFVDRAMRAIEAAARHSEKQQAPSVPSRRHGAAR